MEENKIFGLSGFSLKVIACILMTLDHVALLFIAQGVGEYNTAYYILRAIGKISFPIFCFLAVEGAYHSKDVRFYLLRLGTMAVFLDCFGYAFGLINNISIATNPLIGNAFTDLFMGVLMIYLLRMRNGYSILALIPIFYEIFSDFNLGNDYGTIFKSDWGTFSIVLFLFFFLAREFMSFYLRRKAINSHLDENCFLLNPGRSYQIASAIALFFVEACFYLIYRIAGDVFILPNEFVPIGTYSTFAFLFILLYNGKRGYDNKIIKYSFYAYYPLHLIILGILSMFFGVLSNSTL
jgi:hypothetical protein